MDEEDIALNMHDKVLTGFRALLKYVGEDPDREGLKETPERMRKAWAFWCQGYLLDPVKVLKTFEDGASGYDEMIWERNCPFFSNCEHHLAPFFGTVTIAYIPGTRIVGLSKMPRLVDVFARRLQVQERLTVQIRDCIQDTLDPAGVAVVIEAQHMCMIMRGIQKQNSIASTSAFTGEFNKDVTRAEFLRLIAPRS